MLFRADTRRAASHALAVVVAALALGQSARAQQPVPLPPTPAAASNESMAAPRLDTFASPTSATNSATDDQDSLSLTPIPPPQPLPQGADAKALADIQRRLAETEAELADLRAQQANSQPPPTAGATTSPASYQQGSGTSQMGVEDRIKSVEKSIKDALGSYPKVRLSGFFQLDDIHYSQDAASHATLGDLQNGIGFRRARLQALGKLTEFTNFSIEMDFAFAGRPSFMDVWGEQTNLPGGALRIGQYRQPVTMDSWTNVKHLEFLERSAPFMAFDPFRRVGIMDWWVSEDQNTMLAGSIYNSNWSFWNTTNSTTQTQNLGFDDRFGTSIGDNGNIGATVRGSHLLYWDPYTERRFLHIGGGYNFQEIGGNGVGATGTTGSQCFRATTIPEAFVGDQAGNFSTFAGTPNVLDTGRYLAHNNQLLHAELAGNYGSAHFQGEWMGMAVDQFYGSEVYYQGGYLQTGYFLTGETVGYNKLLGVIDYNVQPFSEFLGLGPGRGMCGWGAWEAAFRWSYVNMQSDRISAASYAGGGVIGPIGGASFVGNNGGAGPSATHPNPGVLNEPTLALNWWWNQYTRVQFNYITSLLNSQYNGYSVMEAYCARFQIEF